MTLTKQQWYPHLTRNSFYILSPAKGIRSRRQIISGRLYVRLKGTYSLAEHFQTPVNKLNNLDVNYLKIARSIAGRTKRPRGTRVWEPELERLMQVLGSLFAQNFGQVLRNSKVKPLPTSGKKIGIRLGQRLPRRLTQHERSWQHVELIWCFICERESNTTLRLVFRYEITHWLSYFKTYTARVTLMIGMGFHQSDTLRQMTSPSTRDEHTSSFIVGAQKDRSKRTRRPRNLRTLLDPHSFFRTTWDGPRFHWARATPRWTQQNVKKLWRFVSSQSDKKLNVAPKLKTVIFWTCANTTCEGMAVKSTEVLRKINSNISGWFHARRRKKHNATNAASSRLWGLKHCLL